MSCRHADDVLKVVAGLCTQCAIACGIRPPNRPPRPRPKRKRITGKRKLEHNED
jgi:hypothetical protein